MSTASQLSALLAAPAASEAQKHASALISTSLPTPLIPSKLTSTLSPVLAEQDSIAANLAVQLAASTAAVDKLLVTTKESLADVLARTQDLKNSHEALEDALIDHREALDSSVAHRESGGQGTLRERLQVLSERKNELVVVKDWFSVLSRTEELGIASLQGLADKDLSKAFDCYIELVVYIQSIHDTAPSLAITAHLVAMASSVWTALVKALSVQLVEQLETIGWPKPIERPVDWSDSPNDGVAAAFVDLLTLEKISISHPLPSVSTKIEGTQSDDKPLLALKPLVHPLLLRFRWQFDGDRGTNRIDKPEYPLSHVLNLLSAHERFLSEDIQELLDTNGFEHVDAVVRYIPTCSLLLLISQYSLQTDFTTLLLPPLSARLKHHIPQLLELPPILAHTIYQTLDFDGMLRTRNYVPRGHKGEWGGLSEVILGEKEWFGKWLAGEREFFDTRYFAAISEADAFHIVPEEDFDAGESSSGIRPTNSALRVAELCQQLSDRYRPLPTPYTLPFLFSLHLPMLASYAQRVGSALDAFEGVTFAILPGALADSRAATAGVGGVLRLVRAGVSARWMAEQCVDWGDDAFFLSLYHYVRTNVVPDDLKAAAEAGLEKSEGTLFDGTRKTFTKLADRAEETIVRHVVREVMTELKAYLGRRWDTPPPEDEAQVDFTLTTDLISPLSLFSSLLSTLVTSFPPALSTTLYRRISSTLSATLYDRLLTNRTWSETGANQLNYDIEHGFLQAGREAGISRGVGKGWEVLKGGGKVLALPASLGRYVPGPSFADIMKMAFDDAVPEHTVLEKMEEIGVGEVVGRKEVLQALLRRRPECWR
ncbi:RAD50-interacting protein 1, partial [Phenoliferia sp. Uapishka_3]